MELLIALLWAALAAALAYQLVYRKRLTASAATKRLADSMETGAAHVLELDPKSPEYKLAQAGIRTHAPQFTWLALTIGAPQEGGRIRCSPCIVLTLYSGEPIFRE